MTNPAGAIRNFFHFFASDWPGQTGGSGDVLTILDVLAPRKTRG